MSKALDAINGHLGWVGGDVDPDELWDILKVLEPLLMRRGAGRGRYPRVIVDPKGCWNYNANGNGTGYKQVWGAGQMVLAHRYFWTALVGKIPAGMVLDHLCRNRGCCNPKHLEVVTFEENVRRGDSICLKNGKKTHCKRGHEFTEANTFTQKGTKWRACRICRNEASVKHRS